MGAIYAELHVGGHVFPVLKCTFGVHQATDRRGRVMEKVRFEPPTLMMDVPRGDFLMAWAAAKRLSADIVFFDAAGGPAAETLTFVTGAYCVNHREEFWAGEAGSGAYLLFLTLSDPDGYRLYAGGPASAFVAPAARDHGTPPVAAAVLLGGAPASKPKLPVIPLAENVLPAAWTDKKEIPSYTEAHKEARWAEYQRDHANDPKAYGRTRWGNSYETTRNNNIFGLGREREYAVAMGAKSRVLKTASTFRQIDMFIEKTGYCGQLKTGPLYLREQEKIDLKKDADLVTKGFEVEYILEQGASKPMLAAIEEAGGTYKIGPQIF